MADIAQMHIRAESFLNKINEMLHAFGNNDMTQEVSYLLVSLSSQVKTDNAHMHISCESLLNKTDEMLHAFGTNRMTQQFPICEY